MPAAERGLGDSARSGAFYRDEMFLETWNGLPAFPGNEGFEIPEPGSILLVGVAGLGLIAAVRRRRRA